jgi:hypothetical protein
MPKQKCKLCGEPILLVHSGYTGDLRAFNAEPVKDAVYVIVNGRAHSVSGHPLEDMIGGPLYAPHETTCSVWLKRQEKQQ